MNQLFQKARLKFHAGEPVKEVVADFWKRCCLIELVDQVHLSDQTKIECLRIIGQNYRDQRVIRQVTDYAQRHFGTYEMITSNIVPLLTSSDQEIEKMMLPHVKQTYQFETKIHRWHQQDPELTRAIIRTILPKKLERLLRESWNKPIFVDLLKRHVPVVGIPDLGSAIGRQIYEPIASANRIMDELSWERNKENPILFDNMKAIVEKGHGSILEKGDLKLNCRIKRWINKEYYTDADIEKEKELIAEYRRSMGTTYYRYSIKYQIIAHQKRVITWGKRKSLVMARYKLQLNQDYTLWPAYLPEHLFRQIVLSL